MRLAAGLARDLKEISFRSCGLGARQVSGESASCDLLKGIGVICFILHFPLLLKVESISLLDIVFV